MDEPKLSGLLIRAAPGSATGFAAAAPKSLKLIPLLPNAAALRPPGAAPAAEWFLAEAQDGGDNPWDAAHALLGGGGLGLSPGQGYVEPDLEQRFLAFEPSDGGLAARGGKGIADPQDETLPMGPGFAWHLRDEFTQLARARAAANGGRGARIAHVDTGYDPGHATQPRNLRVNLSWDFILNQRDAVDPGGGENPGHGTATLGILAANAFRPDGEEAPVDFGAAPEATVIPLRIANSVVLFKTSALARALDYALAPKDSAGRVEPPVDVLSLSMGGLASQAWADAVNHAYLGGICLVAAAGNNYSVFGGAFPTRFIVYPARFHRVIAACGVMADHAPYFGLPSGRLQGCYGPASKMATAISAYTPNISWAERGAPRIVDMNGQGTSAATPQVAATAALWVARNRAALDAVPEKWRKVEAIRRALFDSARRMSDGPPHEQLGHGILQAERALGIAPRFDLPMTPPDSAELAALKGLLGWGIAEEGPRQEMFALEAAQLIQRGANAGGANPFEELLPDPDRPGVLLDDTASRLVGLLIDHPASSKALREHLGRKYGQLREATRTRPRMEQRARRPPATQAPASAPAPSASAQSAATTAAPSGPTPPYLRLRGYALDPSLKQKLETAPISEVVFKVPWEDGLAPGPVGEYLEVIDYDPASAALYEPVNLNDRALLAQDGLSPSEGNPKFHQQMAYAVSSLTIRNFEAALGRRALWAPGPPPPGASPHDDSHYVQRLRIYPHALREANAYYSPAKKALLFGYFRASTTDPGEHLPGGQVFTCLSHDIVAHETAHALLDGMHRRFIEPTNPDVRAFHEGFADVVALLQHFTFPEILRHQIAETRGELRTQANLLGQMAAQFGRATGMRGALRDYIGRVDPASGRWMPRTPRPTDYEGAQDPHSRGAVLVAAIFDAFLSIYEARTRDLLRLATGGTGVLAAGAIHPDLVQRLSNEAAKSAGHVLRICIRALDYCPPVDLTFGEYLRALITADRDLVRDDDLGYRVAFIEAFRKRGIFPRGVRTLSEESLSWRGTDEEPRPASPELLGMVTLLRDETQRHLYARSRQELFLLERELRLKLRSWLGARFSRGTLSAEDAQLLGIDPSRTRRFEIHSARVANRVSPDGEFLSQFVIELLQRKYVGPDGEDAEAQLDGARGAPDRIFEGGATVIVDLARLQLRYIIRKRIDSRTRLQRQLEFAANRGSPWNTYFEGHVGAWGAAEPFALMHRY